MAEVRSATSGTVTLFRTLVESTAYTGIRARKRADCPQGRDLPRAARRAHVTGNGTIASTRQFEPPPNQPIGGAGFGGLYAHGRTAAGRFSGDADRPPQPPPRPTRGLSAARARGHKGGWKPLDPNAPRAQMAKTMYQDKSMQVRDICQTLRISRSTLYRWMASQQQQAATPIQA